MTLLLTFVGIAALLTIAPGPDSLLVLRTAVVAGRGAAMRTGLGVATGCLMWGAAAGCGVTAVLAASQDLYMALRWAGAAYLGYLAFRAWRGGATVDAGPPRAGAVGAGPPRAGGYLRGLLTNVANPKVGVVYLSLLPQFIPPHEPVFLWSLLLTAIHDLLGLTWFAVIVTLADRLGPWLRRPRVGRALDRVAGTAFLGFAVRLVLRP